MSEEFKKKFDELLNSIKKDLDNVSKKIDEHLEKGDVYRAYRVWRDIVLDSMRSIRRTLDDLVEELKKSNIGEEELRKLASYVRDGVKEVIDRLEDMGSKIRDFRGRGYVWIWLDFRPFKHILRGVVEGMNLTMDNVMKYIDRFVEDVEKALEDVSKRVTQVVSVRIKEKDLEIIDKLVEAGIFRSRSEAVAFFTGRGIQASKEWIEKALEHAKKIKELQESIRREIESREKEDEERKH
jgi:Arc/MetJ-type ribon-helix-helix transcriptional regulator/biotin operon repressor